MPVCHTLKLQCEANSKYVTIMKSIVFVVKEYLGGVISQVPTTNKCVATACRQFHKLNVEMLC